MKLISFSHDSNLMGAQRSLAALLADLQNKGHQVKLILPGQGKLSEFADQQEIPNQIMKYPYPSGRPLRALKYLMSYPAAARRIRKLITAENPDMVHYNTAACVAPAMALRDMKVKKIWHLRERAPRRKVVSGWVLNYSDIAVANCKDTLEGYPLLIEKNHISMVHNGIEIPQTENLNCSAARQKLGLPEDSFMVLFAGNLLPHKNPSALVKAAARFKKMSLDARFVILGDGPLRGDLVNQVKELDLDSSVSIPGFRSNALDYIAAADVVVIPSFVEPFPRIGLEAMANSKPVVAADVGGMAEQVVHQETGFLYVADDMEEMTSHLKALHADSQLKNRLGKAGFQRVKKLFSIEAYSQGFLSVCDKLIKDY